MARNQNQPPAGHPEIEFTPSCTQVKPVDRNNGYNAWVITLEDGTEYQLTGLPQTFDVPGVGVHNAYQEMSSSGLCSIDGHDMPLRKVELTSEEANNQLLAAPTFGSPQQAESVIEEIPVRPVLEPPSYGGNSQNLDKGGDPAVVIGILAFGGGAALIRHLAQRERAYQLRETTVYRNHDLEEEIYYAPEQERPDVSSRPVHVPDHVGVPSPWAGGRAGSFISQGFGAEIRPETERKYVGNAAEISRKPGGNTFSSPETGRKPSHSFQTFPGNRAEINSEMLTQLQNEFDLRFQEDENPIESERAFFTIDVENIDAQMFYEQLRGQGIHDAKTLGQKIFGVYGGRKWSTVSQILSTWSSEYESQSTTIS